MNLYHIVTAEKEDDIQQMATGCNQTPGSHLAYEMAETRSKSNAIHSLTKALLQMPRLIGDNKGKWN